MLKASHEQDNAQLKEDLDVHCEGLYPVNETLIYQQVWESGSKWICGQYTSGILYTCTVLRSLGSAIRYTGHYRKSFIKELCHPIKAQYHESATYHHLGARVSRC